jgi:3-methyladenine DNA glycosylase AlkC
MAQGFSLKDQLFNPETVGRLGDHFEKAGVFQAAPFTRDVLAQMGPLELKARINLIAAVLADYLPDDFPAAAEAILAAMPPPLDPTKTDDDFGHFIYAPLGVFVETHGIADHRDLSLDLLAQITKRFSMEFSIRAFLNAHEGATMERMQDWVTDDNYHVRRLVSEGTRPKLPWGQGVGLTSTQTLPLLDQLHVDKTRYVTRSVANHLNDISKFDAGAVIDRLSDWKTMGVQTTTELTYMRKHALRGLVKAGHAGAMRHLGFRPDVDVAVSAFAIAPNPLKINDTADVSFTVNVPKDASLIIDYVVDFMKANGKTAPKVFKCKQVAAKAGVPIMISKKHKFKGDATTFRLYPGAHRIHVQINGRIVQSRDFDLQ